MHNSNDSNLNRFTYTSINQFNFHQEKVFDQKVSQQRNEHRGNNQKSKHDWSGIGDGEIELW